MRRNKSVAWRLFFPSLAFFCMWELQILYGYKLRKWCMRACFSFSLKGSPLIICSKFMTRIKVCRLFSHWKCSLEVQAKMIGEFSEFINYLEKPRKPWKMIYSCHTRTSCRNTRHCYCFSRTYSGRILCCHITENTFRGMSFIVQ